jgi:hypothetical protein
MGSNRVWSRFSKFGNIRTLMRDRSVSVLVILSFIVIFALFGVIYLWSMRFPLNSIDSSMDSSLDEGMVIQSYSKITEGSNAHTIETLAPLLIHNQLKTEIKKEVNIDASINGDVSQVRVNGESVSVPENAGIQKTIPSDGTTARVDITVSSESEKTSESTSLNLNIKSTMTSEEAE